MGGLYNLKTAGDLYGKLKFDYENFSREPDDYKLFNLLATLCHLREWICPEGHSSYKNIDTSKHTNEQKVHLELYDDPNYKIIAELCNRSKHFNEEKNLGEVTILDNPLCGLATCGDSLGQKYYFVEGTDLRRMIQRFFLIYKKYFEQ